MNVQNLKTKIEDFIIRYFSQSKLASRFHTERYQRWYEENINKSSILVSRRYSKFDYVFRINHGQFAKDKSYEQEVSPGGFIYNLTYPRRDLGNNLIVEILRGGDVGGSAGGEFLITDLGNTDIIIIATNNKHDATAVALRYRCE